MGDLNYLTRKVADLVTNFGKPWSILILAVISALSCSQTIYSKLDQKFLQAQVY